LIVSFIYFYYCVKVIYRITTIDVDVRFVYIGGIVYICNTYNIRHNAQDYSLLYINAVSPAIYMYEGLLFTYMWKALVCLHHFTERGYLGS